MDVKTNMLGLVIINVKKDIANESAAHSAIGHFGQEVSKIEPSPDCMVQAWVAHFVTPITLP
jgi:hypothetical protein